MPRSKRASSRRRYPWDDWFRRASTEVVRVERWKDYDCMPHAFGQIVRNVAASEKYRLRVSVKIEADGAVEFCVVGKLEEKR